MIVDNLYGKFVWVRLLRITLRWEYHNVVEPATAEKPLFTLHGVTEQALPTQFGS